jgi:hypothetical protein
MSSRRERENKRAYEKPRLRVIELAAEEVLGVGCKTTESKPGGSNCWNNNCVLLGS